MTEDVVEGIVVFEDDATELAIVDNINHEHEMFIGSMREGLEHAVRCGQLLNEQKKRVPYGEWLLWIGTNCNFGRFAAANYMKLADRFTDVDGHQHLPEGVTSIQTALAVLKEEKQKQLPSRTLYNGEEEVDVFPNEARDIERSAYETRIINRNPAELEGDFETITVEKKEGNKVWEETYEVSLIRDSKILENLRTAYTTIEDTFRYLTEVPEQTNGDNTRRIEAAYIIEAMAADLSLWSSRVNMWRENNPNRYNGEFRAYNVTLDDPTKVEEEASKPKYDPAM